MKDVLVTRLRTKETDNVTRTILYGIPNISVGQLVFLRFMNREHGSFYVSNLVTKSLDDWTDEELSLLHANYTVKSRLWNKLERAYRIAMPGNVLITLVELVPEEVGVPVENSVAFVEPDTDITIDATAEYVPENPTTTSEDKPKRRTRKKKEESSAEPDES